MGKPMREAMSGAMSAYKQTVYKNLEVGKLVYMRNVNC